MRISRFNPIDIPSFSSDLGKLSSRAPEQDVEPESTSATAASTVSVSARSRELAEQARAEVRSDFDEAKVARLREAVTNGTLAINKQAIASGIVARERSTSNLA